MPPTPLLPIDQVVAPDLITPELQTITSFDGEEITYFLYKPAGENAPVVVVVHGGPEARFAPRYDPFIIRLVVRRHRCGGAECSRLGRLGTPVRVTR